VIPKILRFVRLLLLSCGTVYSQPISWQTTFGLPVHAIEVHPSGTIFLGTMAANALHSSADLGHTWFPITSSFIGSDIQSLAFDKQGHIFAAACCGSGFYRGLYRSTNGGTTWTLCRNDDFASAIALDDTGALFFNGEAGVYRSTDNGDNWASVSAGLPAALFNALKILPDGSLFLGTGAGIYRSSDGGTSWARTATGLIDTVVRCIAVNSHGVLFAGTKMNKYPAGGGVYRSKDRGETWAAMKQGLSVTWVNALCIGRNDELFAGTYGGGVFKSTDDGENWTGISGSTYVHAVAVDSLGYLYVGSDDGLATNSPEPDGVGMEPTSVPRQANLKQNFPNPFNPTTVIRYFVPSSVHVVLKVYDLLGSEIATLVDELKPAGTHSLTFDGSGLSGGVYFYRIIAGDFGESRKLLIIR
jgi:photosystem II stability/assembly factor-like uncharacterized protein